MESQKITKEYLLDLIGEPSNEQLRYLKRLIEHYKYGEHELMMLHEMIDGATPKKRKREVALNG